MHRSGARWRGADLRISSTLMIISAPSWPDTKTCLFTLYDSVTFFSDIHAIQPKYSHMIIKNYFWKVVSTLSMKLYEFFFLRPMNMKELSFLFPTIPKWSILTLLKSWNIPVENTWSDHGHIFASRIFQLFRMIKIGHFGIAGKRKLSFFIFIGLK